MKDFTCAQSQVIARILEVLWQRGEIASARSPVLARGDRPNSRGVGTPRRQQYRATRCAHSNARVHALEHEALRGESVHMRRLHVPAAVESLLVPHVVDGNLPSDASSFLPLVYCKMVIGVQDGSKRRSITIMTSCFAAAAAATNRDASTVHVVAMLRSPGRRLRNDGRNARASGSLRCAAGRGAAAGGARGEHRAHDRARIATTPAATGGTP
jgi:hypothetical protein